MHFGGRMLEILTRLKGAMPASRRASSKLASFSLCRPVPFVKKIWEWIIALTFYLSFPFQTVSCPQALVP